MNIKTIALATIIATGIPVAVQAQETDDLQNYQVSCSANSECSDFNVNYEQEGDKVAQTRRTRTRRTRSSSSDSKYYAGVTLGLFFPGDIEDSPVEGGTGFGGSVYGGYNFTEQIGADLEGLIAFGSNDIDDFVDDLGVVTDIDGSYTLFGVFANPRFTYAFEQGDDESPYVFASPGLGFGSYNIGGDVGDDLDADNIDDSASGFAIQGKVGAGYPVTEKIDIIGQARYQYIFGAYDVLEPQVDGTIDEESEGLGTFGIEVGANYKF